ncbi:DUF177 domain-containing protein [bacterium]|nr:DUF177 domain-containing protein [bacterium]
MGRTFIAIEEFKLEETELLFHFGPELFESFSDDGLYLKSPVDLKIKLITTGNDYYIRGQLRTSLLIECSRCLTEFEIKIDTSFNNIYTQSNGDISEEDEDIDESDLETSVIRDDRIDLIELIHEQLILHTPLKPLCREDCKGLCPQCGQDLNLKQCSCVLQKDTRFSQLKQFFNDYENPGLENDKD